MRAYRQHPIFAEQHVVWMVALFTAMTLLLSLLLVRPAH
jgi:hypothetical protein